MKAALVYKPYGEENLKVSEVADPVPKPGEVLISVQYAVLNPVDVNTILNKTVYGLKFDPHIPGAEIFGIAASDGKSIKKGDRVIVYPRWWDGTCKFCKAGKEYLCEHGGILGVFSSGGFCEKVSLPEQMLLKVPEDLSDQDAVSLPVGGLTSYHALRVAGANSGEKLLVYGASGNTGIFAMMLGKEMGMEVYAVSEKDWVRNFGAKEVFKRGGIPTDFKADVIINSLGGSVFSDSLNHIARTGRIVTFGVLTGATSEVSISKVYPNEVQILGSTGGTLSELKELISVMQKIKLSLPTHKVYKLEQIREAMREFSSRTGGRILISMA